MTITQITPDLYQTSPEHRQVCDAVVVAAGLSKRDVRRVELIDGKWNITVNLRDDHGRLYRRLARTRSLPRS